MFDLTAASDALKRFYLPSLRMQLNDKPSPTLAQIESSSEQVEGLETVLSIHTGRNVGLGARGEFGDLPTAGNQGYKKVRVGMKYTYGRMQISGPVITATKSDAGSFVRAVSTETQRLVEDARFDMNRQIFGDAIAALAIADSNAGPVVTLLNPTRAQFLTMIPGTLVDIGSNANPVSSGQATIVSTDRAAGTVTLDAPVAVASGDAIRRSGSYAGGVGSYEITGLPVIINEGDTLFTVDGATEASWNAYVNDNDGTPRTPTELLLEEAVDEVAIASGMVPSFMVAPHSVVRNYGAQLQAQKRYNDTVELKGGFKGLSVSTGEGEIGLMADRFCPDNTIFMPNTAHLMFHEESDWDFMDDDGSVLNRVPNKDAYEATLFKYCELTTDRRNAHGVLKDIQGA